jgi:hypothetical protein
MSKPTITIEGTVNAILGTLRVSPETDVQCENLCWHSAREYVTAMVRQAVNAQAK